MLPVDKLGNLLWQNKEGTEHHRACTQAWVYPQEPDLVLLEEQRHLCRACTGGFRLLHSPFIAFTNVDGPIDLAIGNRTSHDCETNTSVVIRS